jgi:AcrR family transcriptional regulator
VTETPALTRRDRMRAATMEEITATARRLLVEQGPDAASLRAIAREMGMTAPGLYRYYSSREELLRHVIGTIFRELAGDIRRATQQADPEPASGFTSESARRNHIALKMIAACIEFRRWALHHREEFALLFGVPVPGFDDDRWDIAAQCALEFAGTFYLLFLELWNTVHFPVLADAEIDPVLRPQLRHFRDKLGADIPDGAILVFTRCWVVLYGAVAMEVFGHLGFALEDPAPMFEFTLGDLTRLVGLEYPLPAP